MNANRVSSAVVLLFALAACAPADDTATDELPPPEAPAPAPPAPPADLEAANEAFTAAWNQEDPAVLAGMFTENATVVNNDTASFTGRQEIQDNWLQPGLAVISGLESNDGVWTAQGQDFQATGTYSYTATTPDGDVPVTGRYETTWTRDTDGQWRVSSMQTHNDPMTTTQ